MITEAGSARGRPLRARQVIAVALGNALEFYDFLTFAFFAIYIGRAFFPATDPGLSLLASLATFGAGFLTRPLGAWVLGRLGDRVGRKPAMLLSFTLIGGAIVGLALTPSYAAIGIAAPILAILFRLIQGFALGGEVGASTAFLVEAAAPARRGLVVSLQFAGQEAAVLAAGLVGVALTSLLGPAALSAWGWRLAMLLGAGIIPIGLVLRRSLEETLVAPAADQPLAVPATLAVPAARDHARVALLGMLVLLAGTIATYTLNYLTTFAIATLGMPAGISFGATVAVGLTGMVAAVIGGGLSDRFGRKPLMLVPWLVLVAIAVPVFHWLAAARTGPVLWTACVLMKLPVGLTMAPALAMIGESLPARIRSGAVAVIYAVAISVFGGSTQLAVSWLTRVTGNPVAPAWYMTAAGGIGIVAILLCRESAPRAGARG